jgi:dihydrodipicolinate synthase/N-acetylneuraminate lyase
MSNNRKHFGIIVPMVTPVTAQGDLDEASTRRVIDFLIQGRMNGIFVLGTTGESPSVPRPMRLKLVELTVKHVAGRALVYAGINDNCLADSVEAANRYFKAGVDAVVALLPNYYPIEPPQMFAYFKALLDRVNGPLVLYNIPQTTRLSIPIEVIEKLVGHSRLVGFKDSERDETRLANLLARLGGHDNFSIFVGLGDFMAEAFRRGAVGATPGIANLLPEACERLYEGALANDAEKIAAAQKQVTESGAMYQRGRNFGQMLAALKTAMNLRGLCGPDMLPPLQRLNDVEREKLRQEMVKLEIL